MAAGRGAVCRTRSSGRQRRCGGGIHSPEPGATRCCGGRMPAGRRLLGPLPRMRPVRARCAGRLVPCREVLRKRSGGGRTSPAEPAPATGAGTREAAASARLQASACRICAIRPRPAVRTAGNCRRPRLFALGRTPPYPRFQHSRLQPAGIRCDRTCGLPRRGRKPRNEDGAVRKRGGCPTNLGPPPSSVPPAIREFSRRGGSRRVDKTCRTASARRPERSTPRGCSLRPRPARRPEALRAIWLRRRTPPRLRADRA